ncbi:MAG TPA: hypothetical protein VGF15_00320 [Solirubrobacteraceae bacterium]|jgi:hypothetical protein
MSPFATAGGGFLLAVLWFDLMFDVQALGKPPGVLPEVVLASIAAYYARVTTAARPMNWLVATVMLGTVTALAVELAEGRRPLWVGWASLALSVSAIVVAGARTVPSAVRLGLRGDTAEVQSRLARSVLGQHLFCFAAIGSMIVLQLAAS